MKKILILLSISFFALVSVQAAVPLLDYDFTGSDSDGNNPTNNPATPISETPYFYGINFRREMPTTTDFSAGYASSTGWNVVNPAVGADPAGDFYKFSLSNYTDTGSAGDAYTIKTISLTAMTVGTGAPTSFSLDSNFNNLTPPVGTGTLNGNWTTYTFNANINIVPGENLEFYLYGLGASSGSAAFDVSNVLISGIPDPVAVPEPSTYLLFALGVTILAFLSLRKRILAT